MIEERIGSAAIEEQYRDQMALLGRFIDELLNGQCEKASDKKHGFVLMLFSFETSGRCNYLSNGRREDVITMLKEQLSYFEGMPDAAPSGRAQ